MNEWGIMNFLVAKWRTITKVMRDKTRWFLRDVKIFERQRHCKKTCHLIWIVLFTLDICYCIPPKNFDSSVWERDIWKCFLSVCQRRVTTMKISPEGKESCFKNSPEISFLISPKRKVFSFVSQSFLMGKGG